jgi:N-acetylglucosaminyldiphosphoundecaprenol N-acetyl-beta-D-mannosaminyltransferase
LLKREIIKILGVNIDNVTLDEVGEFSKELVESSNKSCKMVVAPNTEFIMTAWKDKEFFEILNKADFATPDSVGVIIGGKLQKKPFKERIPGQAYFRKVIEVGTHEGWTFYFLGGEEGIAEKARDNVLKDYPNCKIIGCHEGFFEKDSEEEVIKQINELQPNVLFVAMGAPIQEKWIYKHKSELKVDIATGQRWNI